MAEGKANVVTHAEKEAYRAEYEAHEGIKLDHKSIVPNPGWRKVSKLSLNSLWGKFGQKDVMRKHVVIDDVATLFSYLLNEKMVVKRLYDFE